MLALVVSSFPSSPQGWLDLLVVVSLKATLLLALAAIAALALARASAAARHLAWSVGLIGLLALLPLALWAPSFGIPGLDMPRPSTAIDHHRIQLASASGDEPDEGADLVPSDVASIAGEPVIESTTLDGREPATPTDAATPPTEQAKPFRIDWTTWILGVWVTGAVLMTAWLVLGLWVLARISRRAERVTASSARALLERCASELGLRRPVELWSSDATTVPCTWGVFRSRVLIPKVAFEWPVERLRVVLLHELAHVARRDCLTQTLAQLACALFWFHPLAWYGARRLRIERERACDDRVLDCHTEAADYAEHLLAVVRAMRGHGLGVPGAVAFARPSQFEGRLLAVLDTHRVRSALSTAGVWRAAVLAAVIVLPLALLRPWAVAAQAGLTLNDGGRARPEDAVASELVTVPASETTLERRLSWVTTKVAPRGSKGFWVAYSIPQRSLGPGGYLSDNGPLDLRTLDESWTGPRLGDVLAGRSRKDPSLTFDASTLVLAYHFAGIGARSENVDRIRVQTMGLPADFGRQPLYWLGRVEDRESFDWARRVENGARGAQLRSAALEAASIHADDAAVRGHLQQVLRSQAPSQVRSTAAERLHRFSDTGTLQLLKSTAHNDRSPEVRESAIEAIGQMSSKESVRLLSEMARDPKESAAIRRAAVEALGEKASDEAAETLEILATSGSGKSTAEANPQAKPTGGPVAQITTGPSTEFQVLDEDGHSSVTIQGKGDGQSIHLNSEEATDEEAIQREAVESLANLPPEKSLPKLLKIARTHPNMAVRREAVETMGELGTAPALDALLEFAWDKKESELARAAVEAMESYDRAAPKLIEIAKRHNLMEVRHRAVESLGNFDSRPEVLAALDDLVRNDPSEEIQHRAVESISQFPEEQSLPRLEKIARTHPRVGVRRRAIEAIAEMDPDKAAPILESLISQGAKKGS